MVAAPGRREQRYSHGNVPVWRFPTAEITDLTDLYGRGDAEAARSFAGILDTERPDIVHLHAFTTAVSVRLVREVKQRGIPVVFTYHTPTVSCQRGTLMRWGREVCDGYVDLQVCTRCTLHGLGLPQTVAYLVGSVPVAAGSVLGAAGLSGGMWTALRMKELVRVRGTSFHALMRDVDRVVAVSHWVESVLLVNGVPPEKITVSRHGLDEAPVDDARQGVAPHVADRPLRLAFLGRLDPIKGVHLLIEAFRSLPDASIELDVYGVVEEGGEAYAERIRTLAADDPRVVFQSPVPNHQAIAILRDYHLLAVPSQGLETGPLVVLEAFAAGIPVIGSNLGGIAELVDHDVNGLLVLPSSVEAWRDALRRLLIDPRLLARLTAAVRPPRKMEDVTTEMVNIYEALMSRSRAGQQNVTVL
jgi:glycosyltransferase involved in cell wall biosynthesis